MPTSGWRPRHIFRMSTAVIGLAAVWVSPSIAQTWPTRAEGARDSVEARVDATLLVDVATAVPGVPFHVGVLLRMDPGWHVYWKNSGDAGLPTEIAWTSSNTTVGPLEFPAPTVFLESGNLARTFGYEDEVLLFAEAEVSPGESDLARIHAEVRLAACKQLCILDTIHLETVIPLAAVASDEKSPVQQVFDHYAQSVPRLAEEVEVVVASRYSADAIGPGDAFELIIGVRPCPQGSRECPSVVAFALAPGELATDIPDAIDIESVGQIARRPGDDDAFLVVRGRVLMAHEPPKQIHGVLGLLIDGRLQSVAVALPFPSRAKKRPR